MQPRRSLLLPTVTLASFVAVVGVGVLMPSQRTLVFAIAQLAGLSMIWSLDWATGRSQRGLSPPSVFVNPVVNEADPVKAVQVAWTVIIQGALAATIIGGLPQNVSVPWSVLVAVGLCLPAVIVGRWLSLKRTKSGGYEPRPDALRWSQMWTSGGAETSRTDVGRVLVLLTGLLGVAAYEVSVASSLRHPSRAVALPAIPVPVLAQLLIALLVLVGLRAFLIARTPLRSAEVSSERGTVPTRIAPSRTAWFWIPLVAAYVIPLRFGAASMLRSGSVAAQPQWRVYWVVSLAGFAVLVVTGTGWYRNWSVFGRTPPKRTRQLVLIGAVTALVALTETFAAANAVTYSFGVTTARPGLHRAGDYFKLEGYYAWYLADSIPQLDAANTLQWRRTVALPGSANGALLLSYKVLVLVPVVSALVWLIKRDE